MNKQDDSNGVGLGALRYVDTHCHLDDDGFEDDLAEVLDRSRELGVRRWINVGFNPERWQASVDLVARYPGMSCMLGVHPGNAAFWNGEVSRRLSRLLDEARPVAVGEIGLDLYRGEINIDQQVAVFNAQLDLALDHGLPAAIHMRAAESEILAVLRSRTQTPRLLFHSFDGSGHLTDWILGHDAAVGVGGLATRTKSRHIHRELKRLTLDRLVLETDSPYLVPNGFKHRRNTPESIPRIAAFLAGLFERSVEDVARQTTRNAELLFERLPPA